MSVAAKRLWQAFELVAISEEMLRSRLRRENPGWSEVAVEREVNPARLLVGNQWARDRLEALLAAEGPTRPQSASAQQATRVG